MAFEAVRIAIRFMTPVILLTDGYIANGAEPWQIPRPGDLAARSRSRIRPSPTAIGQRNGTAAFLPYERDERLVRPWAIPGTPGLEHRIGGIEKARRHRQRQLRSANHEHMIKTRAKKIANIAHEFPILCRRASRKGELLVIGWGGTYGAIATAVQRAHRKGLKVAQAHLRYLNPMPQEHRRGVEALQEGSGSGAERRSTAVAVARRSIWSMPSA